ncbi:MULTISPECIES: helix-turn-helix domain-containing protein [unclassified Bradyrhizobium]|uniref:helix-turn-helix domain-containing protein n=1 Tax=unclassified Bradyrhizobium TaxID=2631580 RepID=UPI001CD29A9B|nr:MULTISPECIES: helix-turn-helix transcriptional regulator [unclassified Bradyrhizobium]MCA1386012.1 helix-turn-helix transcriptional regulator [Bradyrhizobium sp. BRP05]MCA1393810.1 helix-turn-helix transcriptional regulator [Bradyrhizobium sp. IC3123]MCA1423454.1 helix-turn-helix transcriptional regulator [Bradyrhizobium sp. BRP23]MCA1430652.1 helix-turn-helix transcriptional regulator [Bradyrhizobium sp. NBAIM16]MCA1473265.1 helix-turn-helix transcriptional regulator [Bradyrhizobium sp. IC
MRARALVAYNVRRIRVQRGIPQEQLAYDAGVDRSYMSGLERQQANPTIDLLDRLAETLGVAVSELFVRPTKGAPPPATLPKGRKPKPARRKRT